MKRIAIAALAALTLTGCFERPVIHASQAVEYEVIGIDPPKHFYVDLKRVVGGEVIDRVYVSKRCSRYNEVYIGQRVVLTETVYHYVESGRWRTEINARPICPGY